MIILELLRNIKKLKEILEIFNVNEFYKRLLSSILLFPLVIFITIKGSYIFIIFILICLIITIYEWIKMKKNFFLNTIGIFFLFFSFFTILNLRYVYDNGTSYLLLILMICIATDIGGYIFGKIFKGPNITKISPKKTYSGMFGGYFLSFTNLVIVSNFTDKVEVSTYFFILVLIISTISQIGDIIISYFKRLSKIKDTGKLIPGHGGILDRIDGMIFVFPIIFLIKLFGFINI